MYFFVNKCILPSDFGTNYTIIVCVFVQLLFIFEKTVDNTVKFVIIITVPVYNVILV